MAAQTITLLSDWGLSDHYAAVVRAKLFSYLPDVRVEDISHLVPRNDIYAAAFMAFDAYRYFPEGTVHIVGVNDIASPASPHMVVKLDNHFFIGADNGFFSILQILTGKKAQEIYEIDVWQDIEVNIFTFPARDLFPKVAVLLLTGTPLDRIGKPGVLASRMLDGGLFLQRTPEKDRNGNTVGLQLAGKVLYIDGFGNLITNITAEQVASCARDFPFAEFRVGWKTLKGSFVKAYMDVPEGEIALIFLENGLLEISINRGNAGNLLGMDKGVKLFMCFRQAKK